MQRQSHAVLDRDARVVKGRKIAAILQSSMSLDALHVLDVGAGGGFIAEYFSSTVGANGRVVAVDTKNQLPAGSKVEFRLLKGTRLPFEDNEFDLVISNHVIEHVGTAKDQLQHLRELTRVVKTDGVIYLATPNRWTPMEPHFRLPFLSWLPPTARSAYVRMTDRGTVYDCAPLTRPGLRHLSRQAGLVGEDVTHLALTNYGRIELTGIPGQMLASLPDSFARLIAGIWCIPSLIFLFTPSTRDGT